MQIIECQFQPINFQIENNDFGLNQDFISAIVKALFEIQFITPQTKIQLQLSNQILLKLEDFFENFNIDIINIKCDERLNYKYDGVFINEQSRIGLEIQFRPDFLKDVTRFQMGFCRGRIDAMIYIVSINRDTINSGYLTMPQYNMLNQHLSLFNWLEVPILLLGINCDNN
jgi:hypothetical protein